MTLVDFLLNLVGLWLWLRWRAIGVPAVVKPSAGSFVPLLKPASPRRYGQLLFLIGLFVLLDARAWLYWRLGPEVKWVPLLNAGVVSLQFNSVSLSRMAIYSAGSFGVVLIGFYLWLLLLSLVNRSLPDSDLQQRWVRLHLGWFETWPAALKLAVPLVFLAGLWCSVNPAFVELGMVPAAKSAAHLIQQGLVVASGAFLTWKYPVGLILFIHIVNSYLYLGTSSFWQFTNTTARHLLRPLAWVPLRAGAIDFVPVLAIALVFFVARLAERGLTELFARLPL